MYRTVFAALAGALLCGGAAQSAAAQPSPEAAIAEAQGRLRALLERLTFLGASYRVIPQSDPCVSRWVLVNPGESLDSAPGTRVDWRQVRSVEPHSDNWGPGGQRRTSVLLKYRLTNSFDAMPAPDPSDAAVAVARDLSRLCETYPKR